MKTELTELRRHLKIYNTSERNSGRWHSSHLFLLKMYKRYGTLNESTIRDLLR
jgi:hypothetical protein